MKSNEALYKAIGEIKEEYVPNMDKKKRKPVKRAIIGGLTAAAAVLGIFFSRGAGLIGVPVKNWEPVFPASCYDPENTFAATEKIPFQDEEYDMIKPYSSPVYLDLSQEDGNPWKEETAPKSLPVFKRLDCYGSGNSYIRRYFTEEQLADIAEKAASALDTDIIDVAAVYDREGYLSKLDYSLAEYFRENNMPMYFKAECGGEKYGKDVFTITAYNGLITLYFSDMYYDSYVLYKMNPLLLPEGSGISGGATDKEFKNAADYLIGIFNGLFQYNNPTTGTYLTKYSANNEAKMRNTRIYDMTDDEILNILNYNFSYATFNDSDESNGIESITVYNYMPIMEYLGDYPVMSPEEAKEMLINNGYYEFSGKEQNYIKSGDKVTKENIKKIELVYQNPSSAGYCAPYYHIYIEARDEEESGEPEYQPYMVISVPAVREEYFKPPKDMGQAELDGEILNAIPSDKVKFPDGSEIPKENAAATDGNAVLPALTFDFAFIRFAKPEYRSTLDDPDCYDFEKGEGVDTPDFSVEQDEWCRVKVGDMIYGGLTVKSAKTKAVWYFEEPVLEEGKVAFDGTLTMEGILYRSSDTSPKAAMFFPIPEKDLTVSVMYTTHREDHWIVSKDGEAFITDSEPIWINFDKLPECFDEKYTVKAKVTLENIVLEYNESANGFHADIKDYEILK